MDTDAKQQPQSANQNGQNGSQRSLRGLPSVDRVLLHPAIVGLKDEISQNILVMAVRETLDNIRQAIMLRAEASAPNLDQVADQAASYALSIVSPGLRPVINATGVIIHTNLGRAPLSRAARDAVRKAASYSNLEYSLDDGKRGSRYSHATEILRRVTGCEDALVVNNNAAALVLILSALAQNREVILSRGQSVEIGGGFRIPEIMKTSGARLVEVGTTNRTYARDYDEAITDDTAMLMRVHASNFRIIGFTTEPTVEEMARLAHARGLMMVDDVGSGALLDTTRYGLLSEPMAQSSLEAGADLVLFSGDKLLGGPQCGIIVGKSDVVARLKQHPLTRALRVDKLTLAALEATLLHYLKGEAEREIPVWRMISKGEEEIKQSAELWAAHLRTQGWAATVERGRSTIGGGSLPGETLPTWLVAITPTAKGVAQEQTASELAAKLRQAAMPVIARVEHGALLLDPRTVMDDEVDGLLGAF